MGIAVLGPLSVDGAERIGRRDRVVLETMATRLGRPVSADLLIDALWGDTPPSSAHKVLQGCIVRLRKVLGPTAITTSDHGYVLVLPPDQVDARRFERIVVRARELLSLGESDRAGFQLTEALALWNGDPFADLDGWAPAEAEVRRLVELHLEAEELRVDAHLRSGRHGHVLAEAQTMVRAAPLRERRWTLLALAQYQAGQQAEALRTLHRLRRVLAEQLGIDPGPDVAALEQAILRQDAALLTEGPVVTNGECPYQGLMPYDVDDADRFFGRAEDVAACLGVLARTPVLALVGPSGSGKSSLLRAGVAAALHRDGRATRLITPGRHPMRALTAADGLPRGTVLLIDQFEEVFSLCADPHEQQDFLQALVDEAADRTIALALRADRLADLAAHASFARLVEQGLYLVGGLSEAGLREAVEAPARQAGLMIEPGLVDVLVREVEDDPGALPLMSHALLETWKRRESNTLTVAGYRASGGIHGAVAQSAERLYGQIEPGLRHLMRDLVLRLVAPGHQGEPVLSPVPTRQVATDPDMMRLIDMLVAARLVTSGDGVLEITHEALARAWPRLRSWLDDDVEGQRILHHLSAAADAWETLGRPDSELYRGVRLVQARDWRRRGSIALTEVERDFLEASRATSEAEADLAAEHARRQARLIGRLRLVLAGAVVLLVLALAAGGVAVVQSDRAGRNATTAVRAEATAQAAALSARAQRAGAQAVVTEDIDLALLLGVAGVRLQSSPQTLSSLTQVLARRPALVRSWHLDGAEALAVDISPDGRRVVTVDATHEVRLVDLATGHQVATRQVGAPRTEMEQIRNVEFAPDGQMVAVASTALSRHPVVLLRGNGLAPVAPALPRVPGGPWRVTDLTFSRDGTTLAAVLVRVTRGDRGGPVTAVVWHLRSQRPPTLVDLTSHWGWASVALSPDGRLLYSAPGLAVHDLTTGAVRPLASLDFDPGDGDGSGLEVSPDGRFLAVALGTTRAVALVDARTGRVRRQVRTTAEVDVVRFDRSGERLLTTTWPDRETTVWDTRSGARVAQFPLGFGAGPAVALTPDGATVVSGGHDHALRSWDVDGDRRFLRRIPVQGLPWTATNREGACFATPSPSGGYVAFALCRGSAPRQTYVLLDVARRRAHTVRAAREGFSFGGGSWSHDRYVNADGGTVELFDGRRGRLVRSFRPGGPRVVETDFSPDGSRLVVAELDGRISMVGADTLSPLGKPVDLGKHVCCVAAGPDDWTAFVLMGGPSPDPLWNDPSTEWALVDLEHGTRLATGHLSMGNGIWAAYSPDGRYAAATGFDGEVEVIDLHTHQPVRPPLRVHDAGVFWGAFSPDGSQLVTTGANGSVVVWDSATGTPVSEITAPNRFLVSAEFRPDGHSLLVAPWSGDPAVYVWDPSAQHAIAFACRAVGRDLSGAEWQEYFGDEPYRSTCPTP
ncbi:WD40 repeat protein/DNA-binding SARP family transcriptional activator/energy-coupling factor transporter ATP-binding protein EcfA2 [Nocardioides ginsengisegetis]|uniref:WD40 repeat protein/DNA-binding SARP family transcriptional activator/energy-coupling factor transporter ATP-binding protein EcfA2 n=1 Tax=Nocardioides ginsengisegetis TaxID=661491 RepID=A0A7W3IX05_9ACTN|nr:WD40 repeat protein/DNA-binding SARP family transcriptional activator/energy-coupling factor transporter ATP-binding protein EcfA2 [Nocardioides ginsengisegetis]